MSLLLRSLIPSPLCRYLPLLRGFCTLKPAYNVLFFGTDDISVSTLQVLHMNSLMTKDKAVSNITVVCPSNRKIGRKRHEVSVPVKRYARDHGLHIIEIPSHLKSLKQWDFPVEASYDVGVVVSFGYFLHSHILSKMKYGAINMHPSLLPQYRGPAPIQHALLNGDKETGVSIIDIDPRAFDVGRVLLQEYMQVPDTATFRSLANQLAGLGASCVLKTLKDYPRLKRKAVTQDESQACSAPKICTEDGYLTLNESASEIYRKWQAFGDSIGITVTYIDKRVKLCSLAVPSQRQTIEYKPNEHFQNAPPGSFFFEKRLQALWLKCAQESYLLIAALQQQDRKVGTALDFANGHRLNRTMQRFYPLALKLNN